jgi:hypothetical protein
MLVLRVGSLKGNACAVSIYVPTSSSRVKRLELEMSLIIHNRSMIPPMMPTRYVKTSFWRVKKALSSSFIVSFETSLLTPLRKLASRLLSCHSVRGEALLPTGELRVCCEAAERIEADGCTRCGDRVLGLKSSARSLM